MTAAQRRVMSLRTYGGETQDRHKDREHCPPRHCSRAAATRCDQSYHQAVAILTNGESKLAIFVARRHGKHALDGQHRQRTRRRSPQGSRLAPEPTSASSCSSAPAVRSLPDHSEPHTLPTETHSRTTYGFRMANHALFCIPPPDFKVRCATHPMHRRK
jgi:hypothetical protein